MEWGSQERAVVLTNPELSHLIDCFSGSHGGFQPDAVNCTFCAAIHLKLVEASRTATEGTDDGGA